MPFALAALVGVLAITFTPRWTALVCLGLGLLLALGRSTPWRVAGLLLGTAALYGTWADLRRPPAARADGPIDVVGRLDDSGRILQDGDGRRWRLATPPPGGPGAWIHVWGAARGERLRARAVVVVQPSGPSLRRAVRRALSSALTRSTSPRAGALLRASLLGERERLPPDVRRAFVLSGAAHLLCISGLHVGLLALLVLTLARASGGSPREHRALVVVVLLGFLALVGPRPPTVRATVAGVAFFLAPGRGDGWNRLAFALLAVLAWDPTAPAAVGFRLSFGCVAALLALAPLAQRWIRGRGARDALVRRERPRTWAASAAVAFLGTVPLLATQLGELPLATIVLAVPTIALFTALLALGASGAALAVVFPPLGAPLVWLAGLVAQALIGLVELAAAAWPAETVVPATGIATAIAGGLLALAAARRERGAPARALLGAGTLVGLAVALPRPALPADQGELLRLRGGLVVGLGPGEPALGLGRLPPRGAWRRLRLRRRLGAARIRRGDPRAHLRLPGARIVRSGVVSWVRVPAARGVGWRERPRAPLRLPDAIRRGLPPPAY